MQLTDLNDLKIKKKTKLGNKVIINKITPSDAS